MALSAADGHREVHLAANFPGQGARSLSGGVKPDIERRTHEAGTGALPGSEGPHASAEDSEPLSPKRLSSHSHDSTDGPPGMRRANSCAEDVLSIASDDSDGTDMLVDRRESPPTGDEATSSPAREITLTAAKQDINAYKALQEAKVLASVYAKSKSRWGRPIGRLRKALSNAGEALDKYHWSTKLLSTGIKKTASIANKLGPVSLGLTVASAASKGAISTIPGLSYALGTITLGKAAADIDAAYEKEEDTINEAARKILKLGEKDEISDEKIKGRLRELSKNMGLGENDDLFNKLEGRFTKRFFRRGSRSKAENLVETTFKEENKLDDTIKGKVNNLITSGKKFTSSTKWQAFHSKLAKTGSGMFKTSSIMAVGFAAAGAICIGTGVGAPLGIILLGLAASSAGVGALGAGVFVVSTLREDANRDKSKAATDEMFEGIDAASQQALEETRGMMENLARAKGEVYAAWGDAALKVTSIACGMGATMAVAETGLFEIAADDGPPFPAGEPAPDGKELTQIGHLSNTAEPGSAHIGYPVYQDSDGVLFTYDETDGRLEYLAPNQESISDHASGTQVNRSFVALEGPGIPGQVGASGDFVGFPPSEGSELTKIGQVSTGIGDDITTVDVWQDSEGKIYQSTGDGGTIHGTTMDEIKADSGRYEHVDSSSRQTATATVGLGGDFVASTVGHPPTPGTELTQVGTMPGETPADPRIPVFRDADGDLFTYDADHPGGGRLEELPRGTPTGFAEFETDGAITTAETRAASGHFQVGTMPGTAAHSPSIPVFQDAEGNYFKYNADGNPVTIPGEGAPEGLTAFTTDRSISANLAERGFFQAGTIPGEGGSPTLVFRNDEGDYFKYDPPVPPATEGIITQLPGENPTGFTATPEASQVSGTMGSDGYFQGNPPATDAPATLVGTTEGNVKVWNSNGNLFAATGPGGSLEATSTEILNERGTYTPLAEGEHAQQATVDSSGIPSTIGHPPAPGTELQEVRVSNPPTGHPQAYYREPYQGVQGSTDERWFTMQSGQLVEVDGSTVPQEFHGLADYPDPSKISSTQGIQTGQVGADGTFNTVGDNARSGLILSERVTTGDSPTTVYVDSSGQLYNSDLVGIDSTSVTLAEDTTPQQVIVQANGAVSTVGIAPEQGSQLYEVQSSSGELEYRDTEGRLFVVRDGTLVGGSDGDVDPDFTQPVGAQTVTIGENGAFVLDSPPEGSSLHAFDATPTAGGAEITLFQDSEGRYFQRVEGTDTLQPVDSSEYTIQEDATPQVVDHTGSYTGQPPPVGETLKQYTFGEAESERTIYVDANERQFEATGADGSLQGIDPSTPVTIPPGTVAIEGEFSASGFNVGTPTAGETLTQHSIGGTDYFVSQNDDVYILQEGYYVETDAAGISIPESDGTEGTFTGGTFTIPPPPDGTELKQYTLGEAESERTIYVDANGRQFEATGADGSLQGINPSTPVTIPPGTVAIEGEFSASGFNVGTPTAGETLTQHSIGGTDYFVSQNGDVYILQEGYYVETDAAGISIPESGGTEGTFTEGAFRELPSPPTPAPSNTDLSRYTDSEGTVYYKDEDAASAKWYQDNGNGLVEVAAPTEPVTDSGENVFFDGSRLISQPVIADGTEITAVRDAGGQTYFRDADDNYYKYDTDFGLYEVDTPEGIDEGTAQSGGTTVAGSDGSIGVSMNGYPPPPGTPLHIAGAYGTEVVYQDGDGSHYIDRGNGLVKIEDRSSVDGYSTIHGKDANGDLIYQKDGSYYKMSGDPAALTAIEGEGAPEGMTALGEGEQISGEYDSGSFNAFDPVLKDTELTLAGTTEDGTAIYRTESGMYVREDGDSPGSFVEIGTKTPDDLTNPASPVEGSLVEVHTGEEPDVVVTLQFQGNPPEAADTLQTMGTSGEGEDKISYYKNQDNEWFQARADGQAQQIARPPSFDDSSAPEDPQELKLQRDGTVSHVGTAPPSGASLTRVDATQFTDGQGRYFTLSGESLEGSTDPASAPAENVHTGQQGTFVDGSFIPSEPSDGEFTVQHIEGNRYLITQGDVQLEATVESGKVSSTSLYTGPAVTTDELTATYEITGSGDSATAAITGGSPGFPITSFRS